MKWWQAIIAVIAVIICIPLAIVFFIMDLLGKDKKDI